MSETITAPLSEEERAARKAAIQASFDKHATTHGAEAPARKRAAKKKKD